MKIINAGNKHITAAAKILFEEYYSSLAIAKKTLRAWIKKNQCFVAIENRKVVGVLRYTRDFSHYANYIEDIAVPKRHRGRGIARELLQKFIEVSKKETPKRQKYALSSTDTSNKISRKMHLKLGFREIGRLKGLHYGKDEIFFAYKLR